MASDNNDQLNVRIVADPDAADAGAKQAAEAVSKAADTMKQAMAAVAAATEASSQRIAAAYQQTRAEAARAALEVRRAAEEQIAAQERAANAARQATASRAADVRRAIAEEIVANRQAADSARELAEAQAAAARRSTAERAAASRQAAQAEVQAQREIQAAIKATADQQAIAMMSAARNRAATMREANNPNSTGVRQQAADAIQAGMNRAAAARKEAQQAAAVGQKVINKGMGEELSLWAKIEGKGTGVRRELLVLAHEMVTGNWTRFMGSWIVMGERLDAFRLLLSPTGLAIGGVAAVLGTFAFAAAKGAYAANELTKSLVVTGNAAGMTLQRWKEMSAAIAGNTGNTIGAAHSALDAVIDSGAFTGKAVQPVAELTAKISHLTGETADKVVQDFTRMGNSTYEWAKTSTLAINNLSVSELQHIRALEDMGKHTEAQAFAAERINAKLSETAKQLGYLPGLLQSAKQAWSSFWDAAMDVGRPETPAEKIQRLENLLQQRSTSLRARAAAASGGEDPAVARIQAEITAERAKQKAQEDTARQQAENNEIARKGKLADANINSLREQYGGIDMVNKKLGEFRQQVKDLQEAAKKDPLVKVPSASEIAKIEEGIRRSNMKGDNVTPNAAFSVDKARAKNQIDLLRDQLKTEESMTRDAYQNNEISVEKYYAKRRDLLLKENALEMQIKQQEQKDAQSAMGHALNASQRTEALSKVIKIEGEIALLKQQQTTAVQKLAAEEARVNTQLQRRIELIKQAQQLKNQEGALNTEGAIAAQMQKLGLISNAALLEQQKDLEQRRFEIAKEGLDRRMAIEGQSPEAIAQINAQIEDLEQQHADKMALISMQMAENKMKPLVDVWGVAKSSADGFFQTLSDRTTTFQQKFMKLVDSIISGISRIAAQIVSDNLFGGGASGGSNGGLLGGLFGMLAGSSAGTGFLGMLGDATGMSLGGVTGPATQAGLDDLIASVASFDIGTNYVPKTGLALIHQGEAIIPKAANRDGGYAPGGGMTVHNNFALPAQMDNRTMAQIAAQAGGSISLAMRRNK